jgi:hypothetical protein
MEPEPEPEQAPFSKGGRGQMQSDLPMSVHTQIHVDNAAAPGLHVDVSSDEESDEVRDTLLLAC